MKLALILILIAFSCALSIGQTEPTDVQDPYKVLVDRNMFLRERSRPRPASTQRAPTTIPERPPEVPETLYVLRGVVIEDGALRAYFENLRGGMTRVSPGDAIATGEVTQIAIDAVAYDAAGQTTWIEIGHNLLGAQGGSSSTPPAPPSQDNVVTSAPPTTLPGDPANMSLEERMKLRAQQGRRR